jgi:hypothetical protein
VSESTSGPCSAFTHVEETLNKLCRLLELKGIRSLIDSAGKPAVHPSTRAQGERGKFKSFLCVKRLERSAQKLRLNGELLEPIPSDSGE